MGETSASARGRSGFSGMIRRGCKDILVGVTYRGQYKYEAGLSSQTALLRSLSSIGESSPIKGDGEEEKLIFDKPSHAAPALSRARGYFFGAPAPVVA